MSQIAIQERRKSPIPLGKELEDLIFLCKTLSKCPYYQKMGESGILAIALNARELGLPLMMCLNGGMYTFSGQITLSSQLINMMIVNAGHRVSILKIDTQSCRLRFWRYDRPIEENIFEYEYTIDMAAKAGLLHKDNWKKNPQDMLFARCISGGGKKFMSDVLMGVYSEAEIYEEDFKDSEIISINPVHTQIENQCISEEQIKTLNDLIEQDIDKEELKKKITSRYISIEKIPLSKYEFTLNSIKQRQEKQKLINQLEADNGIAV